MRLCLESANNKTGSPVNARYLTPLFDKLADTFPVDNFNQLVKWMVENKAERERTATDEDEDESPSTAVDFTKNVSLKALSKASQIAEYFIDGIFVRGQAALAFGGPKDGKTSLFGVELSYCLANGVPFLGHFNISTKRRILFLSGESGIAALADGFHRCCIGRGGNPDADFEGIVLSIWLPRFGDASDLTELGRRAADAEADLVIVDPAGPCMSAAAASTLAVAYAELRGFSDACLNVGASPLLLHHSIKNANVSALGLRAAAGAGFSECPATLPATAGRTENSTNAALLFRFALPTAAAVAPSLCTWPNR